NQDGLPINAHGALTFTLTDGTAITVPANGTTGSATVTVADDVFVGGQTDLVNALTAVAGNDGRFENLVLGDDELTINVIIEPIISGLDAEGGDLIVFEKHLADGTQADEQQLTQSGVFKVDAPKGIESLSIGGQEVFSNGLFTPVSITTSMGHILDITSYNALTGEVGYSYRLTHSEDHGQSANGDILFEEFAVQLQQSGGSTANAVLTVGVVDDVPTVAFTNAFAASNVITGFWSANAGADSLPGFEVIQLMAFDGARVNGQDAQQLKLSDPEVDGNGNLVYQGGFNYEATGGIKDVAFTLILNEDGSYQIELTAVPVEIIITPAEYSKAVEASGPTETYEISYEKGIANGPVTALASVAEAGQPLSLQGMDASGNQQVFGVSTIGNQVNASEQGIGIGNNNIDSYNDKGVLTSESLIYNPTDAANAISVFFKGEGVPGFGQGNSTDVLYLTVTSTTGETQTILLDSRYGDYVVDGDVLTPIEGGYTGGALDSYTVTNPFGDGAVIDFMQVTAGFYVYSQGNKEVVGTTKVKVNFGFSTELEQELPLSVDMDFTATVTDGDGDTANAAFSVSIKDTGPFIGTEGDDAITGTDADDTIYGGAGNDIIYGGIGADYITGGLGDDIIDLGSSELGGIVDLNAAGLIGDGAADTLYWSAEEAESGQNQHDVVKSFEL
ncbi:MAG: hypothetical protein WBH20_14465, partial [Oceanisphaera sp.]|uniref:calcium-binding protein n=1 Tax=Oceanisphaera sp. TaxID=1929979 RepID=UPI003C710644